VFFYSFSKSKYKCACRGFNVTNICENTGNIKREYLLTNLTTFLLGADSKYEDFV